MPATPSITGLTSVQVDSLRSSYGFNELPEKSENLLRLYFKNFWGPLPWLLECTIFLAFFSGKTLEAVVMLGLLFVNSAINLHQRHSADKALASLRHNLQIMSRVFRDGSWLALPSRELLPGDLIRMRTGDIVPADAILTEGQISVDLSSLTGESVARDLSTGDAVFTGGVVKRGEATATVTAIGGSTQYGKTTQLLEVSHPPTHMEKVIFTIIKCFFILNLTLSVAVTAYALITGAPLTNILTFVIVLLVTSIPVAFPTMFAVAQSYGALQLSRGKAGVLVRRLAAVQEAAMMDVLCVDKTGTLTQNRLEVVKTISYGHFSKEDLLQMAAACSNEADEDAIDRAILQETAMRGIHLAESCNFVPFDSATKCTEACIILDGKEIPLRKGFPDLMLKELKGTTSKIQTDLAAYSEQGLRVVAVIAKFKDEWECVGLIALSDPLREEAPALMRRLRGLGIRVVMITGDGKSTAAAIAHQLGLRGAVVTPSDLESHPKLALSGSIFAEVYPKDKLRIVKALQEAGHTVGMTGDGVNDAPALHQAEVGIAVSGATDVAKQSASFILTNPGLEGIVATVQASREVYARIRTWALNKSVKAVEVSFFTSIVFMLTHSYVLSPMVAILLVLANDFVAISIATDKSVASKYPAKWEVKKLVLSAAVLALVPLTLMLVVFELGRSVFGFDMDHLRTVTFVGFVFMGQACLFAVRSFPHAWSIRPSLTMIGATAFSFLFTLGFVLLGGPIAALPVSFVLIVVA
ncbi:MAG: cation-transporting ATPase, partial [Patescibacteria group bacterium]|nr:cation-transporting ATPase [Patescibacteria group bacterium]